MGLDDYLLVFMPGSWPSVRAGGVPELPRLLAPAGKAWDMAGVGTEMRRHCWFDLFLPCKLWGFHWAPRISFTLRCW